MSSPKKEHLRSHDDPEDPLASTTSAESLTDSSSIPTSALTTDNRSMPVVVDSPKSKMYHEDGSFNEEAFYELIGNDIRRKIITKLAKFPRYASDLAIDLGVSKQAIKKHLDKLDEFGIVEVIDASDDQKKQFYQISPEVALFAKVDLTPNYFSLSVENSPESLREGIAAMKHDPHTAMTSSKRGQIDYKQLNYALRALGSQLYETEQKIASIEEERKKVLLEKTLILNRIQMIINALVENDLEKEVIFALFYDTNSTVEGLSLEEILNQLFLRKKNRAGVKKYKYTKTDPKMISRGQEMLRLLQMLINNFGFIRTENMKLFFDFED